MARSGIGGTPNGDRKIVTNPSVLEGNSGGGTHAQTEANAVNQPVNHWDA